MKVSGIYGCRREPNKEFCFKKPKGIIPPKKGISEEFRNCFSQELDKYIEDGRIEI